jgi:predicted RNA-binding protein with PUA-like domain
MKSEAECYSIDDLARDKVTPWEGVRNFQARNFMKEMSVYDVVLFYHSNLKPSGVVGIGEVVTPAHTDASAMRKGDEHFDPRSTRESFRASLGLMKLNCIQSSEAWKLHDGEVVSLLAR